MRNPFSRALKHEVARPSLAERATIARTKLGRVLRPAAASDPILAAIAETQRLTLAREVAAALPQPAGNIDPLPEQDAAQEAFWAYVDAVLLKTVPTTAAGCVALAQYAVEFLESESFVLDEDQGNEHVRILGLIARSPLR